MLLKYIKNRNYKNESRDYFEILSIKISTLNRKYSTYLFFWKNIHKFKKDWYKIIIDLIVNV